MQFLLYLAGAVFNLLCGDRDDMLMTKIENHFNHQVTEVFIELHLNEFWFLSEWCLFPSLLFGFHKLTRTNFQVLSIEAFVKFSSNLKISQL